MNAAEVTGLENYLHEHIPLSAAMGVKILRADESMVELSAPLAPNINHRETVFGGSASAVAILAAWTLLYVRLQDAGINSRVVIQRNTMSYEHPITTDFTAVAALPDLSHWTKFLNMLKRRGRARISVAVTLVCENEKVGTLEGDFVALKQGL